MTNRFEGNIGTLRRSVRAGVTLCAAVAALAVVAPAAQAYPQGHWACFSTAVHVDGADDPVIANNTVVPCQHSSQSASATGTVKSTPGSAAGTNVVMGTDGTLHDTPQIGDSGSGQGTIGSATIVAGNTVIKADNITTQANVVCTAVGSTTAGTTGSFTLSGRSTIGALTINGNPVALTGGPQDIQTAAGTLHLDTSYQPVSFAIYQRALWLQTPSGDIIIDEAAVAGVNNPCQDGPAPPPPPPPTPGFGCYASAVHVGPVFPFVANPYVGPCSTQAADGTRFSADNTVVFASGLYADTVAHPNPLPVFSSLTPYPVGTYSTASAGATSISIGLDALPISAQHLSAYAAVACSAPGTQSLQSSVQVHGLSVNHSAPQDITSPRDIPLPNGVGVLHVAWQYQNSVYVERRALWLETFLGQDAIVGDALAGSNSNPC